MKFVRGICIVTLLLLSIGCGGSGDGATDQVTNFRFINAVPDLRAVDLFVDAEPYFQNVGYLESSGYVQLDTFVERLTVVPSGSLAPLVDLTTRLQDDTDYTLLSIGPADNSRGLLLQDDNQPSGDEATKVRFVNVSTVARSMDVYVSDASGNGRDVPSEDNLSFGSPSRYRISSGGRFTVIVTDPREFRPLARSITTNFAPQGVYTVLIADTAPGAFPLNIIVIEDRKP